MSDSSATVSTSAPAAATAPVSNSSTPEQTTPITAEPIKPVKKPYKYKADGKEFTEELDDNELQSRLAFAKSADKRMKEAAEVRKGTEAFLKQLKENPLKVLSDERIMGSTKFRELAENYLIDQLKAEQMTPEQRMQAEREKELETYKQREKQAREEQEKQRESQLTQHWQAEYQKTIVAALDKSGLPKNAESISRIAGLMKKAMKAGLDMDTNYIAEKARESYGSGFKSLVQDMDGEQLVKFFGDELLNKIRKYDLGKWQPKNPEPKKVVQNEPARTEQKASLESPRDFLENLRKRNS